MGPQSCRGPIWESWDKMPFGCGPHGKHIVYYKGEGSGFPQIQAVVSLMSLNMPMTHLSIKSVTTMH
jgi:hypothetical protein